MAIRMMCDATDPGAVRDDYYSKEGRDIYVAYSYEGMVLSLGEMNGYDDSDFYAVVWDDQAGEPKRITYASTRGWTYPNGAAIDATPEVLAKYKAWTERVAAERRAAAEALTAKIPTVGKRVRVTSGRKVPIGTEGEIFWYGEGKFDRRPKGFFPDGRVGYRVGLKTAAGEKFYTAATNVTVET